MDGREQKFTDWTGFRPWTTTNGPEYRATQEVGGPTTMLRTSTFSSHEPVVVLTGPDGKLNPIRQSHIEYAIERELARALPAQPNLMFTPFRETNDVFKRIRSPEPSDALLDDVTDFVNGEDQEDSDERKLQSKSSDTLNDVTDFVNEEDEEDFRERKLQSEEDQEDSEERKLPPEPAANEAKKGKKKKEKKPSRRAKKTLGVVPLEAIAEDEEIPEEDEV
jgi:hypothetical protein